MISFFVTPCDRRLLKTILKSNVFRFSILIINSIIIIIASSYFNTQNYLNDNICYS